MPYSLPSQPSQRSHFSPARGLASLTGRDRLRFSPCALVLALSAALAMPGAALAAVADWAGTTSNWFTSGNWNLGGALPSAADLAVIDTAANPAIVDGAAAVADYVIVGDNAAGTLAIVNGGSLVTASASVGVVAGSNGLVLVAGPASTWTNSATINIGTDGTGTLNITNGGALHSMFSVIVGGNPSGVGTIKVDGPGSILTLGGALVIGSDGAGTLTIANGGAVTLVVNSTLLLATKVGSIGILNIGDATGAPTSDAGTLNAAKVQFGAGTGTINFNHISASHVFAPAISGLGTINHNAGNTNLTGDSSGFTGQTNVNGGRLFVNGSLANSLVTVNGGGTLGGNGTVGNTFAKAGGIVAPGNSIGTLQVNGNIDFAAGSIYQLEANAAGQSDKIMASGTATLNGGTVQVLAGAGNYAPATSYTILTATGGVTGTFAGATSNLAFLDPALTYDLNNAYLTLTRNDVPFSGVGQNPGQSAVASGVESLGAGSAIYSAVLNLSAEQARAAFYQLSGEIHASTRGVLLEDGRFVREAAMDRLRGLDSLDATMPMARAAEGKPMDLPAASDLAYWGRAMGSWGHIDGDGSAAVVKRDTAGFLMGADRLAGDAWRVGLLGGYSRSSFDISARNSSGSSDNYHIGVYGGRRWGELALRSGLGYTRHDISTSRAVAFPGFSDNLRADYKAATTQVFGELGYQIKAEQAELEPFVNLAHVNVSTKGLNEQGGAAALSSAGGSSGITFTTLGLRASTNVAMGGGTDVTARGMLGYRHAFGDTTPSTSLAFAGGSPFAMAGVPVARSAAVLEAGLDFKLTPAATLGLSYGGQFGSGLKDQSARVNLNVTF